MQARLSLVPWGHKLEFNSVGVREKSDWQSTEAATEDKTRNRNHRLSCEMQPRELLRYKSAAALPRTIILQYVAPQ